MNEIKESKAMEEVREWKRICNAEVAHLSDEQALAQMIEIAEGDAREMEETLAQLKASGAKVHVLSD